MGNNSTTNRGLASHSRLGSWGSSIDDAVCGPDTLCGDWHDIDEEDHLPLFTNPPTRRGSVLSVPERGHRKPPPLKRSHSFGGASVKRPATTNFSDTSEAPDSFEDFPIAKPIPKSHHSRNPEFDDRDFVPAPVTTSYSSRPPHTSGRRLSEMPQPVHVDNHRRASEPTSLKSRRHDGYDSEPEVVRSQPRHRSKSKPIEHRPPWQDNYIPPQTPLKPIVKEPSRQFRTNHKIPQNYGNHSNHHPTNHRKNNHYGSTSPHVPVPKMHYSPSPTKLDPILQPSPHNMKKGKRIIRPRGKTKNDTPKPFIVGKPPPPKERYLVSPLENEL